MPTPSHINDADLQRDFLQISRIMRCKWDFRNELPQGIEQNSRFKVTSRWNHPKENRKAKQKGIFFLLYLKGEGLQFN